MSGIQYITDDTGKKTAVVIDLEQYGEIWEDFYDTMLAQERNDEQRISFSEVKKQLKKKGLVGE